ncbi:MAG: hypothetical protein JRI97_08305 [Deltaproteobacteria bacterium]|nr:hypothetical protein [Deltaproteobacteria bacterium]
MEELQQPATQCDFTIQDCALAAIATGVEAQNLRELRDRLMSINRDSIYYHFWGGMLRPRFEDLEFRNDFAVWAHHGLHDPVLAERLGIIDPTDFPTLDELRDELLDTIEERLDETEIVPWAKPENRFHFIRSQIVVFDTHLTVRSPEELAKAVPHMSVGSVFLHFVDARRRTPKGTDDFRAWMEGCFPEGYEALHHDLANLDYFFYTLTELRQKLAEVFERHLASI